MMNEEISDVIVKFSCEVEITDHSGKLYTLDHEGQMEMALDQEEIEEIDDSDYMSEIVKSTIEYIADVQREGEAFQHSHSLRFHIKDYAVIVSK